jgi:AraC-like DNA-binding protein
MDLPIQLDWWPLQQLQRHRLQQVFVCGNRLLPPVYSHIVNFPRLELPVRGIYENDIEVGDRVERVHLQPGMALFAAAKCWNLPEWKPGLELLSILFRKTQLGISLISAGQRPGSRIVSRKHSISGPFAGPIPHILSALTELQTMEGSAQTTTELIRALLCAVEDLLRQPPTQRVSHAHRLLEDIRGYIQGHHQYQITRDSVARQFGISPNHLSRLFQTHGGTTFSGYLTQTRIDRAKHLLRSYTLKLDDIAARCGYNDTPYFCHVFKRLTRCTPREYRLRTPGSGAAQGPHSDAPSWEDGPH